MSFDSRAHAATAVPRPFVPIQKQTSQCVLLFEREMNE
jgi:hypothetical protein